MNNVFIGIDVSFTDTAIIRIESNPNERDKIEEYHFHTPGKEKDPTIPQIIKHSTSAHDVFFNKVFNRPATYYVATEIPMGYHGQVVLYAFAATMIGLMEVYSGDVVEYTPTQIKKSVGKGNFKKNMMLKEVYKKYGFDTDNDNTADAYAIARLLKNEAENG